MTDKIPENMPRLNEKLGLSDMTKNTDEEEEKNLPTETNDEENLPATTEEDSERYKEEHIDEDYELIRKTLTNLIDKGNDSLNELSSLAKQAESPRAYEVVSTLINTLSSTSKDLLDIHKQVNTAKENSSKIKKKDKAKEQQQGSDGRYIQNNNFFGTSKDLLEVIRKEQQNMETSDDDYINGEVDNNEEKGDNNE